MLQGLLVPPLLGVDRPEVAQRDTAQPVVAEPGGQLHRLAQVGEGLLDITQDPLRGPHPGHRPGLLPQIVLAPAEAQRFGEPGVRLREPPLVDVDHAHAVAQRGGHPPVGGQVRAGQREFQDGTALGVPALVDQGVDQGFGDPAGVVEPAGRGRVGHHVDQFAARRLQPGRGFPPAREGAGPVVPEPVGKPSGPQSPAMRPAAV
ncbi:hypothetical protein Smic_65180 [Streptomyces microflavus]|uniref:Uncharacterized protein n=1 Tax=Streptomyces microflavus TaxID=1919 RepID=A0A7J0CZS2_STRMI|nr:hypothetical protein Smic_65180 [Streptomyces microflavus]